MKPMTFAICVAFCVLLGIGQANAFECTRHFTNAQIAIDKAVATVKRMGGRLDKADRTMIHSLIDDARMLLKAAEHSHERPQGAFDHARAIAKADAARGAGDAAELMAQDILKKQFAGQKPTERFSIQRYPDN